MLHGDAVDVARETQGEVGHVHEAVVKGAGALDGGGTLMAQHLVHLVEAELVVACRDGGVGCEDALLFHGLKVGLGGSGDGLSIEVAEPIFEEADRQEGGVALVHVVHLGTAAEDVQHVDSAKTKNGLLTEAVETVAAIEMVGEAAVPGVIAFDVGVEEKDGDDVARDADDVEAPGADGDAAAVHRDLDRLADAGKRGLRGPGNGGLRLLSDGIQVLTEVAFAVGEGDRDNGSLGIRRRSKGVASQHPESTGVGGKAGGERDLHGEVSDVAGGEIDLLVGGVETGGAHTSCDPLGEEEVEREANASKVFIGAANFLCVVPGI